MTNIQYAHATLGIGDINDMHTSCHTNSITHYLIVNKLSYGSMKTMQRCNGNKPIDTFTLKRYLIHEHEYIMLGQHVEWSICQMYIVTTVTQNSEHSLSLGHPGVALII